MKEEKEDLKNALMSMYDQYCSDRGHLFMSAGEEASAVLERYGYGNFDPAGRLIKWNEDLTNSQE